MTKLKQLIDEGNRVRGVGLAYNLWLEHVRNYANELNPANTRLTDELNIAFNYSNNSGWFDKCHASILAMLIASDESINTNQEKNKMKKYDVFISHASADKQEYVDGLKNAIARLGIKLFYDTETISWGDDWKSAIKDGLNNCEFGLIVISNNFFNREWTEKELQVLLSHQNKSKQKTVLPLLYGISKNELIAKYPLLKTIQFITSDENNYDKITVLLAKELIKRYKSEIMEGKSL